MIDVAVQRLYEISWGLFMTKWHYPPARRSDTQDDFHGTIVADPYRWLEEPNSPETQAFVAAQNTLTQEFLAGNPFRQKIEKRLETLWDYPKYGTPIEREGRYFFTHSDGLQNQPILYWQVGLHQAWRVLLDPNELSEDGTVAITGFSPSEDGRLLAYTLAQSGSDQQTIRVLDVDTGEVFAEEIRWCKFTQPQWRKDNSGFFYSRYPSPAENASPSTHQRVYWHKLGSPQGEDVLIYARPDRPRLGFHPLVSDDDRYLILHGWHGTDVQNRIYYKDLTSGIGGEVVRLLDAGEAKYHFLGNEETRFFFLTDLDAPRSRIVAIDITEPDVVETVVPEQTDAMGTVQMVGDEFVVTLLHHASYRVMRFGLDGAPAGTIDLPTMGTIFGMTGKRGDSELFFNFQSYLYPPNVFRYDFEQERLTVLHDVEVDFDPAGYTTNQVRFASKDGTEVPMFLTHQKGLKLDGTTPVLVYGYGGFAINRTPMFSVTWLAWLEMGGVVAEVNLRGGNEYGEGWHQAGMLGNKQNVFDDFIGAGEWLIEKGYTRPGKLAIMGGSNGGLLVAACMVQRPDLFGSVICRVPVIDMLRYHKFTAGPYWVGEYGNAEEGAEQFDYLMTYSPLHNVQEGVTYPPTLIATADTDDRVVPMHAKKFAATLQAKDNGQNPLLLRVEMKAGHGLGKPTSKVIEELADIFVFLQMTLNLDGA